MSKLHRLKGIRQKSQWNPQTRSEWLLQPYVQNSRHHKWSPKWFDTCGLHCHSLELIMENHPDTLHSRVFSWSYCWVSMTWTTTNWQPSANSQNDDAISDFWWFSGKKIKIKYSLDNHSIGFFLVSLELWGWLRHRRNCSVYICAVIASPGEMMDCSIYQCAVSVYCTIYFSSISALNLEWIN